MPLQRWVALTALLPLATAVLGPTGANNATTPTAKDGNITVHYVTVGKTKNEFVPNSIVAEVGDIVSFQFYPLNHSVIRSAFGWPCIPIEESPYAGAPFFSGFFPLNTDFDNPPTWNYTVETTDPIFWYCGAPGSCIEWGMLGVINANAHTPISTQIELARKAQIMLEPGEEFPTEGAQASLSKLAHSATIADAGPTSAASSRPTAAQGSSTPAPSGSGGVSTGAVAGIAVGAAAAALIVAALIFFMYRSKRLKKKLDHERATSSVAKMSSATSPKSGSVAMFDQGHPSNQISYVPYFIDRSDPTKEPIMGSWPVDDTAKQNTQDARSTYTSGQTFSPSQSPHLNQPFSPRSDTSGRHELDGSWQDRSEMGT